MLRVIFTQPVTRVKCKVIPNRPSPVTRADGRAAVIISSQYQFKVLRQLTASDRLLGTIRFGRASVPLAASLRIMGAFE